LNYSTIQQAIDANETLNGQTILVDAGQYYGNVVVNKTLSLIGADSTLTTIDGNGTGNVVEINSENSSLSGFTIINSNYTEYGLGYAGILVSGGNNQISGNILMNSYIGISVGQDNCVVTGNEISNCFIGLSIYGSTDIMVMANTIANNTHLGIRSQFSEGNAYFHNNIVNNTLQVFNGGESGEWPNTWDNGNSSGGNYWSDYNGTDTDNDGIGETPYNIGPYITGNIDHYPLMGMFTSFNATSQYSVEAISNSTMMDFQFNGTAISFNVSGENGTTGFCRTSIPTGLINGTLTVFINGTELPYILLPESNSTISYLYFTYSHSLESVIIAPEFPGLLAFALSILVIIPAIMIYDKKHRQSRAL
jgi:parallel beta-helix repeat protein